jgi:hypothetical protein
MRICRLCRFETELDDAVLNLPRGACICLRCFSRETGSSRFMPAGLRHTLTAALVEAEAALAAAAAEYS